MASGTGCGASAIRRCSSGWPRRSSPHQAGWWPPAPAPPPPPAARAHARAHPGRPGSDAILALLTPMGPGGLRVEAIHRVVPDLPLEEAARRAAEGFRVTELPEAADVETTVARWLADPAAAGFLLTDGERLVRVSEPAPEISATVPPEAPAAWRRLDVV